MMWKQQRSDQTNFRVQCDAGHSGQFEVANSNVKLKVGQRIRKDGQDEMWDSLRVACQEQEDGSLAVEIVIFHPQWDKALRIAYAVSAPGDARAEDPTLGFDLEQRPI